MELKGAFAMTSFFFNTQIRFFFTIIKYPIGDTKISSNKGFINYYFINSNYYDQRRINLF